MDDLQRQVTVPLATTTVFRANVGSVAAGVQGSDALRNLSISDGMPLNFIAPSISNGVSRSIVDRDDVASLKLKWQYSCAMFVVGYRPSLTMFSAFIKSKWPILDYTSVILHDDGYFLVKCNSEADVMMLIRRGKFTFVKRPVLVRKWDDQFNFERDILRVVPVWVRLLNLPTKFWGVKSLSCIGGLLGVPIAADGCTSNQTKVNYARLLVKVDDSKPLPKTLLVEDEEGHIHEQSFFIEWIPHF